MVKSNWIKCPNCNGYGVLKCEDSENKRCPSCNGKGIINNETGLPPNFSLSIQKENRSPLDSIITSDVMYKPKNGNVSVSVQGINPYKTDATTTSDDLNRIYF